jgi:hypothetical protein
VVIAELPGNPCTLIGDKVGNGVPSLQAVVLKLAVAHRVGCH